MTMEYPENFYDVVYSRDTILHIKEKEQLFRNFLHTLKPGGKLMISDYCRGDQVRSKDRYTAIKCVYAETQQEIRGLRGESGLQAVHRNGVRQHNWAGRLQKRKLQILQMQLKISNYSQTNDTTKQLCCRWQPTTRLG